VYRRPFVQVWAALSAGSVWRQAVHAGLARVQATAEMDVQLASRAMFGEVQREYDDVFGYQRVSNPGACEYCAAIDGAFVKSADAMPIHNRCGCTLEPLSEPHPRSATPSEVAVHEHGELGAVVTAADHDFTTL
jgi:hypothetical protein